MRKPALRSGREGVRKVENIEAKLDGTRTSELVEELKKRDGVETTIAEPHQDISVKVNGPAIVLVVID